VRALGFRLVRFRLRRAEETLRRLEGGRAAPPWDETRAHQHLHQIVGHRAARLVEVRQPLVLVSQIQRSGGTLLSQLFDHHPQLHAHPHELHTGHPNKEAWPALDLARPSEWFHTLYERPAKRSFNEGYRKLVSLKATSEGVTEDFPFLFPPSAQKMLFDLCVAQWRPSSMRGVFDCYMTSYFNAWLDNRNLYEGDKRWVTAFAARLSHHPESVEGFFGTYPDGRLVSIVRDPRSWYLSARGYRDIDPSERRERDYGTIEAAVALWRESAEAMLAAHERYGERFRAVVFEDLLTEPEATMRSLAAYLGIAYDPILTRPTFNGLPIKADSSFAMSGHGVSSEPLMRYRTILSAEEIAYIEEQALPLYERVVEAAR
jgi:hypothetical protein